MEAMDASGSRLCQIIQGAGLRWLARSPAARIADLHGDYLFELPPALPLPPPADSAAARMPRSASSVTL